MYKVIYTRMVFLNSLDALLQPCVSRCKTTNVVYICHADEFVAGAAVAPPKGSRGPPEAPVCMM